MLRHLRIERIQLLTNNPEKIVGLTDLGVTVAGRLPLWSEPTAENERYLETKLSRLGHLAPGVS